MPKAKTAAKAATSVKRKKRRESTQEQELDGMRVVSAAREGGIDDGGAGTGGKLRVIIEGDSVEKLLSGKARKLAYVQRFDFGMANAGIESEGGTYVEESEREAARKAERDVKTWRIDFIITPMI